MYDYPAMTQYAEILLRIYIFTRITRLPDQHQGEGSGFIRGCAAPGSQVPTLTLFQGNPDSENIPYFREISQSRAPEAVRTPKSYPYFRENLIILGIRSGPHSEIIRYFREISKVSVEGYRAIVEVQWVVGMIQCLYLLRGCDPWYRFTLCTLLVVLVVYSRISPFYEPAFIYKHW